MNLKQVENTLERVKRQAFLLRRAILREVVLLEIEDSKRRRIEESESWGAGESESRRAGESESLGIGEPEFFFLPDLFLRLPDS